MIDGNYFNTVFTTNFDDLINEAFYQFSNSRPIYCAHDSSVSSISITSKRPKIIKLHGDYLFEDIKSTIRETESLEQNMREKLIEFGKEYGIVVVGYSGNDRSIMDVLDFLTKQENYLRNGIYWCLRGSDVVNPQLRKLLWKDKVYPVIIDGFDEFFAQAHSILIKGGLNIGGGVGQSKLQKTLKGILDDKFGLGRNQIIAKQIQEIKNENNKDDISRLISSLAEDSQGASLGLADFKNLLEVESYEQKGDFDAAFKLCEEYYYACESKIAKPKYILKIIQIAAGKGDRSSALTWSEKLLEIDHLNVDFNLKKCSLISGLDRRVEFLTDLKKKFPYNFEIYNELASKKFKLIKNKNKNCGFDSSSIRALCEESIVLYPALSNYAWIRSFEILRRQRMLDPTDDTALQEMDGLIEKARKCNPEHLTTLKLEVNRSILKEDFSEAKKILSRLYDVYKRSSIGKRKSVNTIIDLLLVSVPDFEKNEGYVGLLEEFYEVHLSDESIKEDSQLLLSKAWYFISQKRQLEKAEDYFMQAVSDEFEYEHFARALSLAEVIGNKAMEKVGEKIEAAKNELSEDYYFSLKSDVLVFYREFEKAREYLSKAYEAGLPIKEYLAGLSYCLINSENHEDVLSLRDAYSEHLDVAEMEPFIINFQLAAKHLNSPRYSDVELRNLTAKSKSPGVRICAFSILGQYTDAKRQMRSEMERDYSTYFQFKKWPAIPSDILMEVGQRNVA